MASITVMGGPAVEYGLKTAQKVQLTHNKEVSDALLNISGIGTQTGAPVHQDDPRPGYRFQAFPKMLYKPIRGEDGEKIVMNAQEMAVALEDGWQEEPFEFPKIAVSDPQTEKKALMERLQQAESQNIQMADMLAKMNATLEALKAEKRGPGRPPKAQE